MLSSFLGAFAECSSPRGCVPQRGECCAKRPKQAIQRPSFDNKPLPTEAFDDNTIAELRMQMPAKDASDVIDTGDDQETRDHGTRVSLFDAKAPSRTKKHGSRIVEQFEPEGVKPPGIDTENMVLRCYREDSNYLVNIIDGPDPLDLEHDAKVLNRTMTQLMMSARNESRHFVGAMETVYLPEHFDGKLLIRPTEEIGMYRVDNSELKSTSTCLAYRQSMHFDDHHKDSRAAPWGSVVKGLLQDGWLKVVVQDEHKPEKASLRKVEQGCAEMVDAHAARHVEEAVSTVPHANEVPGCEPAGIHEKKIRKKNPTQQGDEVSSGSESGSDVVNARYLQHDIPGRVLRLREEMTERDKSSDHIQEYQDTMRWKFQAIGVKNAEEQQFQSTSSPSVAVRDAVAKYHSHCSRLHKFFAMPGDKTEYRGLENDERQKLQHYIADLKV